jgi:hypothetical protein
MQPICLPLDQKKLYSNQFFYLLDQSAFQFPLVFILILIYTFMNSFTSLCLDELSHDALMLQHVQEVSFLFCFLNSLRLNESKFLWPLLNFPQPPPFLGGRRQPHVRPQKLSKGAVEGLVVDAFDHLSTEFHLSLCTWLTKNEGDLQQDHLRLQAMKRFQLVFYEPHPFKNRRIHKNQKTDVMHNIHPLDQGSHSVGYR